MSLLPPGGYLSYQSQSQYTNRNHLRAYGHHQCKMAALQYVLASFLYILRRWRSVSHVEVGVLGLWVLDKSMYKNLLMAGLMFGHQH